MLLVKTYLDKSNIHGIGLFAGQDIPRGTRIWEYNPLVDHVYTKQEWEELKCSLPSGFIDSMYVYKQGGKYCLNLDNDRFTNHQDEDYNIGNSEDLDNDFTYALMDIKEGEELTCNYNEFMDDDMLEEYSFISSSRLSVALLDLSKNCSSFPISHISDPIPI